MKKKNSPSRAGVVRTRVTEVLGIAALAVFIIIFIYLSAAALSGTVDMNTGNPALENVVFMEDSVPLNLLWLVLFTGVLLGAAWLMRKVSVKMITGVTLIAVLVLGVLWVMTAQSAPTNDSRIVSDAACAASRGDYGPVSSDYFRRFPFQLGYVLYSEILIRVLHLGNVYIGIELVNVGFLVLTYWALLRLSEKTMKREGAVRLTALLMLTCLPPVLFCTFTYGNIPGIAFGVLGFLELARLSEPPRPEDTPRRRVVYTILRALGCGVCLGLSAALKLNCAILAVAAVILLVLLIIRAPALRKSWPAVLTILLCGLCVWGLPAGAQAQYEKRAGCELGDGIPMVSWAAMGLNEAYIAPGWYSYEYTVGNFAENGYDPARAAEASGYVIRDRLDYFREQPDYAASFFDEKLRSQWNEPSYQSIWTNQVRGQYGEKVFPASWVCGEGEAAVKGYMNVYQQGVFVLSLAAAVLFVTDALRRKPWADRLLLEGLLLPVTVIGGFLYHAVCEAKSQYSLVYLILLLPLAAYAADRLYGHIVDFAVPKLKNKGGEKPDRAGAHKTARTGK